MKKKLTAFVLALCLVLVLAGCFPNPTNAKITYSAGSKSLWTTQYNNILYDNDTHIAYVTYFNGNKTYLLPYYAPNGLPYLYDVESGELVEIEK